MPDALTILVRDLWCRYTPFQAWPGDGTSVPWPWQSGRAPLASVGKWVAVSDVGAKFVAVRRSDAADAAVVFVHGFGGGVAGTFGEFPALVTAADGLHGWDVYDLGYTTSLAPDIRGIWAADPGLPVLANYLRTRLGHDPLDSYSSVAVVAHSMGGLVVQRALVDDDDLAHRVGHVFLFGTPSMGLRKAGLFTFYKRTIADMDDDSDFILDLRSRWSERFGGAQVRGFRFWAVAGDRDEFVPASSSLEPFADEDRAVVLGNHVDIVKPTGAQSLSVQVVVRGLRGDAAVAGPWNSARVAVEANEFQRAVDLLSPHAAELDDQHLVQLALALESLGSTDDALAVLRERDDLGLDASGVLAGRLKRRWATEGRRSDGDDALRLYDDAYRQAQADGDHDQALYHGINVAFLQAVHLGGREAAALTAGQVLAHCVEARQDHWCRATVGEANLHLRNPIMALTAYADALERAPSPRQIQSTYTQAAALADRLGLDGVGAELTRLFRGDAHAE